MLGTHAVQGFDMIKMMAVVDLHSPLQFGEDPENNRVELMKLIL